MTYKDLLESLDLDAAPTTEESGAVQIDTQTPTPVVSQSPNAMILDRWTRRQGRQLFESLNKEPIPLRPIHQLDAIDLADLHSSVFLPTPELVEEGACSDTT